MRGIAGVATGGGTADRDPGRDHRQGAGARRDAANAPRTARSVAGAAVAMSVLACGFPASAAELLELPTRPGVTQGLFLVSASASPPWVVVLFAGDDGNVSASDSGPTRMQGNFVLRTAAYWPDHGDAYAIFDAPSDNAGGMQDSFRLSAEAGTDVEAAVSALRKRYPAAKVALIGTSRGTITVGNVLKRHPEIADAFVLTSPVTQANRGQAGLSGVDWKGNRARVLVLSNDNDGCPVSPAGAAKQVAGENGFDFVSVHSSMGGGDRKSDCKAQSPHGFLGIETTVLDRIESWLNGKP